MTTLGFVAALVLLLAAAWVRAAGAAIGRIPRADALHDAAERRSGAARVARLLERRQDIPPALGLVGTALLVLSAVIAVATEAGRRSGMELAMAAVAIAFVELAVGDVLARLLGRRRPRLVAYGSAPLIEAAVRIGAWADDRVVDDSEPEDDQPEEGEEERELISSVLRFSDTIVREVMVPRPDMVTVSADADADALVTAAFDHGYSRFPVLAGDDAIGVVLVKDLLPVLNGGGIRDARSVMRPPVFVPESKPVADLLAEMRASKAHMALVIDEFGEIAGLVTIEDILEELVGEIADETDDDEIWVDSLDDQTWKVDARMPVEDLADLIGVELPDDEWDTVAGLVFALAERVPEEGERFDLGPASFTVSRMQGRRVAEVVVNINQAAVGENH